MGPDVGEGHQGRPVAGEGPPEGLEVNRAVLGAGHDFDGGSGHRTDLE